MKLNNDHWLSEGLTGKMGKIIAYQLYGKTCFRRAAASYNKVPTEKQAVLREKFKEAHQFGKTVINDPALKAEYTKKAKGKCSAYNKAVSDFMKTAVQEGESDGA